MIGTANPRAIPTRIIVNAQEHIVIDPAILSGKPIIRGTRLSVEFIVQLLAQDWTEADLQRNYPGLTHEQIAACLQYAADVLGSERVYPLADTSA